MADTRTGSIALGASVRWGMDRWIFRQIFSKFAQYGFNGWAILEWECTIKHPQDGAREGAPFIRNHLIRVTEQAFDDVAAAEVDATACRRLLGL